jgi:hypothetical protein
MARVYTRKFDHEEAARLRAEGVPVGEIAKRYGVTKNAIYYATEARWRERALATRKRWQNGGRCIECGGQASRSTKGQRTRCRSCADARKATTVRETTLRCHSCKRWKPDAEFPHNRSAPPARRTRHNFCRICITVAKRQWRERNRTPCVHCGTLVLPDGHRGGRPRCHSCAIKNARPRRRVSVA